MVEGFQLVTCIAHAEYVAVCRLLLETFKAYVRKSLAQFLWKQLLFVVIKVLTEILIFDKKCVFRATWKNTHLISWVTSQYPAICVSLSPLFLFVFEEHGCHLAVSQLVTICKLRKSLD